MIGRWTSVMLLGGAAFVAVIAGAAHAAGLVWNWTPSVPVGLWRADSPTPKLTRGKTVRACLSGTPVVLELRELGYFAGGGCPDGAESILKPIAAVPGDQVSVTERGVAVNGVALHNSGQLTRDSRGHTLPRVAEGTYRVAPGQLWLVSQYNSDSLDSRYFGPVSSNDVIAVVHPVWVSQP